MKTELTQAELSFLQESSLIEGYDYNKKPLSRETKIVKDNSEKAYLYLMNKIIENNKLFENDLLYTHKLLMNSLIPEQQAGNYREVQVYVGSYIPPKAEVVPSMMNNFIEEYNDKKYSVLDSHKQFEKIHPFIDGNGRIGRILWACDLARRGEDIYPILDNFCNRWMLDENNNKSVRLDTFTECRYAYYKFLNV